MFAMADMKEFIWNERDKDWARSWSKVKPAYVRDLAPDEEKCLVFGDLFTKFAKNWYNQMSRSTRLSWKEFLEGLHVQYRGNGMSAGRQYYHTKKRSEEMQLEFCIV